MSGQGIKGWQKALLYGGIALAGIFAGYKLILTFESSTAGGPCTQSGTPCNQAIAPYIDQLKQCAQQYSSYLGQFLKEDAAKGTGITANQQNLLNQLTACMNQAGEEIAKETKSFSQNPIPVLATAFGAAALAAASLWGASQILKSLRLNSPTTGGGTAGSITNAVTQEFANTGEIPADAAASISDSLQTVQSYNQSSISSFTDTLVSEDVITSAEASDLAAEEAAELAEDTDATEAELADL